MIDWEISLSRGALKFLRKNHLDEDSITGPVILAIRRISGDEVNIDLKKLNPPYEGYFRVRVGRLRITFSLNFDSRQTAVEEVNWRGSAYRL